MFCTVFTAGVGLTLALAVWWVLRPKKTRAFKIREPARLRTSEKNVVYDVQDLDMPRLSGKAMWLVKCLLRTWLKYILRTQSIRKSNLDLLRSIDLSDNPTCTPLPLVTWDPPPVRDKLINFEKHLKSERRSKSPFLNIFQLTDEYRSQKVTPLDVAYNIIQFIKDSEAQSPQMNIFTQHEPEEILKIARASTQRYAMKKPLSFLDGVPVGVKEEFDVTPYITRNGTTFWSKEPCFTDASVVKKLRDGGAMIIGMTNMHEIGIGVTGNNANRDHGTPRNPYNVSYYTGGSSSGSAAAVASGLCLVALGSDGGGSIRMPSGACGVVGIKASYGRINKAGLLHTCHTVTHAGPICNSIKDAALVYAYIAGPDEKDLCTIQQPPVTLQDFDNTNLTGINIGVDWDFFKDTSVEVYDKCREALFYLKANGARIVSLKIPELEETRVAHNITILVEMAAGMISRFEKHFKDLNPDSVFALSVGQQLTGIDYFQAQKQRTRAMVFLENIFNNVDCIITPGLGMKVPVIHEDALEYGEANMMVMGKMMRFMALGNLTGIPAMTFPVGYDDNGLPISLQVMSGWWQEHVMLRVANTCEGFVEYRKPEVFYDILHNKKSGVSPSEN